MSPTGTAIREHPLDTGTDYCVVASPGPSRAGRQMETIVSSLHLADFIQIDGCKPWCCLACLDPCCNVIHGQCVTWRPTEPVDLATTRTPNDPMHCLTTVAHGSPVAPSDMSQKTALCEPGDWGHCDANGWACPVPWVSVTAVGPVAGPEDCFDIVDSLTPCCTQKVVLTRHHCFREPFPGDAVLKCCILAVNPAITHVGQWVPALS